MANLSLNAKVTLKEMADKPISEFMPGYLFEMGCDMETGMWAEMLCNRQFATFTPYKENHASWYDLRKPGTQKAPGELIEDWRKMHWFHSGYENNSWYAAPGEANDFIFNDSTTLFQEKSAHSDFVLQRIHYGETGKQFLRIAGLKSKSPGGLAQNGKYVRPNIHYQFSGKMRSVKGDGTAKIALFKQGEWEHPIMERTITGLTPEFKEVSLEMDNPAYEGWATFAIWLPGGAVVDVDTLSLMPSDTLGGWRSDVVNMVRDQIKPGVLRWPGGIIASFYDWRDAVGPRDERPVRTNYRWGGFLYNDVGTVEFYDFCKRVNSLPLICVNLYHPSKETYSYLGKDGKPMAIHEFCLPQFSNLEEGAKHTADWVAYCNAPVGTHPMADLRAKHGHPEPLKIEYWELENEAFRFFQTAEEYARACAVYAKAMKAVDPTIKLGLCTYGDYLSKGLPEMLEIVGPQIDFLADRDPSEENVSRKIGLMRDYNLKHGTKIAYSNTEYVVRSDSTRKSNQEVVNSTGSKLMPRVSWGYTLDWANTLMQWQRHGGDVIFTCYNQFANNHQSSVIDTPREGSFAKFPVAVGALFRDTPARWPLALENYTPDLNLPLQVQAAWNQDRTKLVIYLLNYNDTPADISLDLSSIQRSFSKATSEALAGPSLDTVRTVQKPSPLVTPALSVQTGLEISGHWSAKAPPHSFTQVVLE